MRLLVFPRGIFGNYCEIDFNISIVLTICLVQFFDYFQVTDDSDTDDDSKLPVPPLHSTMSDPLCDRGGQLVDEVMIMDVTNHTTPAAHSNHTTPAAHNNHTTPAAHSNHTTPAAGTNNRMSAYNRAGASWPDESYK